MKFLWKGPEVDGITFSMLSNFLVCRERFRVMYLEGLVPDFTESHKVLFGNMWHVCEEHKYKEPSRVGAEPFWKEQLKSYVDEQIKLSMDKQSVLFWYNIVINQFEIYNNYWSNSEHDYSKLKPIKFEHTFDHIYTTKPNGYKVRLRGKMDGITMMDNIVFLQENKTKGMINYELIGRQLNYDLQTMIYLTVLKDIRPRVIKAREQFYHRGMLGILYNVIKRPLSGGMGTIRKHKPSKSNPEGESESEFLQRLMEVIKSNPQEFFQRWKVIVTLKEINKFIEQCLDPLLEQVCEWYVQMEESVNSGGPLFGSHHWRHPYGVFNLLNEGGIDYLDDYLITGNQTGLVRNELFRELGE